MSLLTHSIHVFFLLPLSPFSATSKFRQAFTQSSSGFLATCPNHLSLLLLTNSFTLTTSSFPNILLNSESSSLPWFLLNFSLFFFFRFTPHIHLTIIPSALSSLLVYSTFIGHFSLAYIMT